MTGTTEQAQPGSAERRQLGGPRWLVLLGAVAALGVVAARQWWAGVVRAYRWSSRTPRR